MRGGRGEQLRRGDRLAPGDRLFVTVETSKPTYVYVVDQDEQGKSYLVFPLPDLAVPNPLPAGTMHRLPATPKGEPFYWKVTSAGGREHFLESNEAPRVRTDTGNNAPRPRLDRPVGELTPRAVEKLCGVGGLAKDTEKPATDIAFLVCHDASPGDDRDRTGSRRERSSSTIQGGSRPLKNTGLMGNGSGKCEMKVWRLADSSSLFPFSQRVRHFESDRAQDHRGQTIPDVPAGVAGFRGSSYRACGALHP